MIFERKKYLDELIAGRGNGLVKIITGVRRCGKSFLLFDIWHNWLLEHGVTNSHIIEIQLDDFRNRRLRKPDALLDYIDSKVVDDGNPYYIVLDEVQLVEEFVEVILSLTHMRNVDVYVSGSNSRFLSILSVSWRIPVISSFPEVEVTRSLSSNLLKKGFTKLSEDDRG